MPSPAATERFERLEETLQLAHQMWRDDDSQFAGTHYSAERLLNHPQPLSRPHPPIMVGDGGERKTLRLPQYAYACNVFFGWQGTPAEKAAVAGHKFEVLRRHCEDVGARTRTSGARPWRTCRRTAECPHRTC